MKHERLHRNLVFATLDALHLIFNEDKQADKVLRNILKRDKRWGSRDRSFIAETTYDIVRWKRLYVEIAEVKSPFNRPNLFRVFGVWATLKGITLPDWAQKEDTPTRRIKGKFDSLSKVRKLRESIPDWLDLLGEQSLGAAWDKELAALNVLASVTLRTNTLKTDVKPLRQILAEQDVDTITLKGYPDALQLVQRQNVFITDAFKNGLFEVQDAASQQVAPLLDVAPGMRVVDACAGAGGKSLHLAALMKNKGQLIAMDIYAGKLQELKRRAKRAGVYNLEARVISSSKDIKRLRAKADRVLIDAPCSGLGTLKRNPDIKWKLQPEFLKAVQQTQQQLLQQYSTMLKPGGKLVYATCSILPQENQHQVQTFLKSEAGASFELTQEVHCSPHKNGHDGFYIAQLSLKG